MITQIYLAYDVHLNSNSELMIAKYKVSDESLETSRGKAQTYRNYDYIGVEIPLNIEDKLDLLRQEGYMPINKFQPASFDVATENPLVSIKLLLLGYQHQILEKFYKVGSGYDYSIYAYITYINMNSGKVSIMKIGNYSIDALNELEKDGYVPFEKSFYSIYSKENEKHLTR